MSGVVASVPKCVLPSTLCVDEAPRVRETVCVSERVRMEETASVSKKVCVTETPCANEMACVSERPSARETACVRSLYVRDMTVGMREHAAASPSVSVL